jgi:hypothetical protein
MSFSPLHKESGGDDAQRSSEAIRLLGMIDDEALAPNEGRFISDCRERLEKYGAPKFWISAKQLFWLRDIKDGQL